MSPAARFTWPCLASSLLASSFLACGCPRDRAVEEAISVKRVLTNETGADGLSDLERLGKNLFMSDSLSGRQGYACSSCHAAEVGFTGPDAGINAGGAVYPAALEGLWGMRKPPTAAYLREIPMIHLNEVENDWFGGVAWDGQASGESELGDPLAEMARLHLLDPLHYSVTGDIVLCQRVAASPLASQYQGIFGPGSLDCATRSGEVMERTSRALAAYLRSAELNAFNSRYDRFLAGEEQLTEQEAAGLAVFAGKGRCFTCHPHQPDEQHEKPLFTNYSYENLGFPPNRENPFYQMPARFNPTGKDWIDEGLGAFLREEDCNPTWVLNALGEVKVPTLRNAAKRPNEEFKKAYGHNGTFKSLADVVHFLNTRDVLPACGEVPSGAVGVDCWPAPDIGTNVNPYRLGKLGLTEEEEAALVAFLGTLDDGA